MLGRLLPLADVEQSTDGFEIQNTAAGPAAGLSVTINKPRVAIYQSFDPSMKVGPGLCSTTWLGLQPIHNADVRRAACGQFDIILPDQRGAI